MSNYLSPTIHTKIPKLYIADKLSIRAVASTLNISPITTRKYLRTYQVKSRTISEGMILDYKLNPQHRFNKKLVISNEQPFPIYYPFYIGMPTSENELLSKVNTVVPKEISEEYRRDICQDLLVALLANEIKLENLKEYVPIFIRKVYKQFHPKRHVLSFDTTVWNFRKLYEVIPDTKSSSELENIEQDFTVPIIKTTSIGCNNKTCKDCREMFECQHWLKI